MNILVTGSTGYIGDRLVKRILLSGHNPVIASRDKGNVSEDCIHFDLNNIGDLNIPKNIDTVVHLAVNPANKFNSENDIFAAKKLIEKSKKVSAQFIFISSQTASSNAPTDYGLTKWHIEQEVRQSNGIVVRLGQVYGGVEKGLFGELVNFVRQTPILPYFVPNPVVQPIHVDDCAIGILKIIEQQNQTYKMFCLAQPDLTSFKVFLNKIATVRLNKYRFFIPIPVASLKILSKFIGLRLSKKFGITRLFSLFYLPIMDTKADLDMLDLKLRPLSSGMAKSGSDKRRRLVLEGVCLLQYLLKEKPKIKIVCRYVRMIEELRNRSILNLPNWMISLPITLALLDRKNIDKIPFTKELAWRINAATIIAESCTQSYSRFNNTTKKSASFLATYNLFKSILFGAFWYICSIIFVAFNRSLIKRKIYRYGC
jgi:nucleoside-diphosphate-sugar epimerase